MKVRNRANGEGTISRNGKRWRGQVVLPNGERRSFSGETQRDVIRQVEAVKREIAVGMHTTKQGKKVLRTWADEWIDSRHQHIDVTTEDTYRWIIRCHLDGIGDVPVEDVTPLMINQHYARKLKKYASTTVNHIHSVISAMLEDAVNLEIISRNPARRVKAPPIKTEEFEPLSEEQAIELLSIARGHRFEAEILIALATGAREAELLGLRWQDVLWRRGSIHIRTTLKRLNGVYFLKDPKSKTSGRTIPIGEYALALLQEHQKYQNAQRELLGDLWQDQWGLVFTRNDGAPIHRSVLTTQFQKLIRKHGWSEDIRFHDLRHTFATLMIERGVIMKVVSEYLGHASVDITQRIYGHVTPKMRGTLLNEINDLMPIEQFEQRLLDRP